MRIVGGKFKSRRIAVPGNITARPTTDFAKEGLFNLLNNRIDFEGIEVLDLFAGTGSIGIEFVSRGARAVFAVEQSYRHIAFMRKVNDILKLNNYTPIRGDVFRYIKSCKTKYDLIFADPPYDLEELEQIPDLIFEHNLLKEEGLLILEHSVKQSFEKHVRFDSHRSYGNVHFSFFI